jgi:hypothetical protein
VNGWRSLQTVAGKCKQQCTMQTIDSDAMS